MIDAISPKERLRRLSPSRWEHRLALCFIAVAIVLALMLEPSKARASDMPPFSIGHPICPGGFTIAQRLDTRNAAGTITKSVWVRKCTNGRIVYGRKV